MDVVFPIVSKDSCCDIVVDGVVIMVDDDVVEPNIGTVEPDPKIICSDGFFMSFVVVENDDDVSFALDGIGLLPPNILG